MFNSVFSVYFVFVFWNDYHRLRKNYRLRKDFVFQQRQPRLREDHLLRLGCIVGFQDDLMMVFKKVQEVQELEVLPVQQFVVIEEMPYQ